MTGRHRSGPGSEAALAAVGPAGPEVRVRWFKATTISTPASAELTEAILAADGEGLFSGVRHREIVGARRRRAREESDDALPRILTIMGSGETTPTMARVHRPSSTGWGSGRFRGCARHAYGFRRTRDITIERGLLPNDGRAPFSIAHSDLRCRPAHARDGVVRIREARLVFTGPGSPPTLCAVAGSRYEPAGREACARRGVTWPAPQPSRLAYTRSRL